MFLEFATVLIAVLAPQSYKKHGENARQCPQTDRSQSEILAISRHITFAKSQQSDFAGLVISGPTWSLVVVSSVCSVVYGSFEHNIKNCHKWSILIVMSLAMHAQT